MKILFFASHCNGLGHLNRLTCIAREIKKIDSRHKILFLTAPGCDTFLKEFQYEEIPLSEITLTENGYFADLDVQVSSHVIADYKPDVIVFDTHFPLAVLKRAGMKKIKTAVVLRKTKKDYFNKIAKLKADLFILPHERRDFKGYDIPKKAVFVGPIVREVDGTKIKDVVKRYGIKKEDFVVTFTCGSGGGRESRGFIYATTRVYKQLRKKIGNLRFIILAGNRFQEKVDIEGITVKQFEPEAINLLRASDLVVAIASYNTCNEIMFVKTPSIIIPAKRVNEEQGERAKNMEKIGISVVLNEIDEKKIADSILEYYYSHDMKKRMKESFLKVKMRIGNRAAAKRILGLKLG